MNFNQSTGVLTGTPSHADAQKGTHKVVIRATDGQGGSATQSFTITVADVNNAPTIVDQSFTVKENQTYVGQVTASDPDNDRLTYSIVERDDSEYFNIRSFTGELYFKLPYKPDYEQKKEYIFQVKVTDSAEKPLSSTATIRVTVTDVNEAPMAYDQEIYVLEQKSTIVTLSVSDEENGPLTFKIQSLPSQGNLKNGDDLITEAPFYVDNDSNLEYQSTKAATEFDSFTYTASDGESESNTSVVRITIEQVNDPGSVQIIGSTIIDGTLTAEVMDNDGVDESRVSYQWYLIGDNDADNLVRREIAGANQKTLEVIDRWEGQRIGVEVIYEDQQGHQNTVYAQTEGPVTAMPIIQKTIMIDDALLHMTVFDSDQIQQKFNIENLEGHTLRTIGEREMMRVEHALLPDSNPNEPLDFNNREIRDYKFYEKVLHLLKESSLLQIKGNSIILRTKPDLPEAFVGTGESKIPIGMSDTLGVFNSNGRLKGIINIRFAPKSVASGICNNPIGENKGVIVLLFHGFNAQQKSIMPPEYFNKIAKKLAQKGAQVFSPNIDSWTLNETRLQESFEYLRCVQEKTGVSKVIVFGHSQGGLLIRQLAYWTQNHEGYNPANGNIAIQSAISVAGINRGGNFTLVDKEHEKLMHEKFGFLYQLSLLNLTNQSQSELLQILIDLAETHNLLDDPNAPLARQFRLFKNIFDDLGRSDGLLDFTGVSLSDFIGASKALHNYTYEWQALKSDIEFWEGVLYAASLAIDALNIGQFRSGPWPGLKESYLKKVINHFFDALKRVERSSGQLVSLLSGIKSEVNIIKSLLSLMRNELENLSNPNPNIDVYAFTDNLDKVQQAIGRIMSVLPLLQDELRDNFIPSLIELKSALKGYRDLQNQPWYINEIFEGSGDLFLGLDHAEVGALEGLIQGFIEVLENLVSLSDRLIQSDLANLMKALTSNNETERERAVSTIASLINDFESFLKNFRGTINFHRITFLRLVPRWGWTNRPLTGVSNALDMVVTSISNGLLLIDNIKLHFRIALGDPNADWDTIINWQLEELVKIQEQLISQLLQTDIAVKHNINLNNLNSCIIDNKPLFEYFVNQKRNRESNSDYYIALPRDTDLTPECTVFFMNLFNMLIDALVPLNDINPRTGVLRTEDVKIGSYSVSYPAAQHINLQHPNTGLEGRDFNNCLKNPSFESNDYLEKELGTKFYSVIGVKNLKKSNPVDKVLSNMMTTLNNQNSDDRIRGNSQFIAEVIMTRRQGGTNPAGDFSPAQIYNMNSDSDFLVKACSQLVGRVLGLRGNNTLNLNHQEITNNSLTSVLNLTPANLLLGKETEGYASTQGELDQCNQSNTITQRKDCLHDLLPRIITMYLAGLIIDYGTGNGNENTSQMIFDTLKMFLSPDFNSGQVEHIDVPAIYDQILEYVLSQ